MLLQAIEIATISAIIGYVYAAILIQPGEALHWLYRFFKKHLTKVMIQSADVPPEIKDMPGVAKNVEIVKEHWLLKPLGACEKCVSGQIAFWLFLHHSIIQSYYLYANCIFTVTINVFTVCLAILMTIIIKGLLLRLSRQ